MPFEHRQNDAVLPVAERRQAGKNLRKLVPRSAQSAWWAPADRPDPVTTVTETGRRRIARLLPILYDRMKFSPFAFLRGSAAIMAADLALTPNCGLYVQSCGDCHSANFGTFASPEGQPVFDLTDFDETLPAPFEWDVKRLATSFAIDASARGLPDRTARHLARTACMSYRLHMYTLSRQDPLQAWRSRVDVVDVVAGIEDQRLRDRELKRLQVATEAGQQGYPGLLERHKGGWRIREKPPLLFPLRDQSDSTMELVGRTAFETYIRSLSEERRVLLDRYQLMDLAFKVVGVGSVGTFCAIGLFVAADGSPLLLQLKEAQTSVLAPFAGASAYSNQGRRVVVGQRMMQTQSDIFLGWTEHERDDQHCYVRQLKDPRLALIGSDLAEGAMPYHATLCGLALARAHARSGDATALAGYMGMGGAFDSAIAGFAMAYSRQVDRDWRLFVEAIKDGRVEAHSA